MVQSGLTRANRIADLLVQDQAHGGIDDIFFFLAAATEHQAGDANLFALNAGNVSARWAEKCATGAAPGADAGHRLSTPGSPPCCVMISRNFLSADPSG